MDIHQVVKILKQETKKFLKLPVETYKSDPFKVLISCLLSLRTKDQLTREISKKLFKVVSTPEDLKNLSIKEIEDLIYPVGFYRTKAKRIKEIAKILIERYNGHPPADLDELLKLKGVGRKTANLVLILGYKKLGICVDTHVHRVINRLGYIKTKNPTQTEFALREKLPEKFWMIINDLLVLWGQNICKPISPYCSICKIKNFCKREGVEKSR